MLQHTNSEWSFSGTSYIPVWHLLFDDDKNVIEFFESTSSTSTTINLFVGTREECECYIRDNKLVFERNDDAQSNITEPN